MYRVQRATGAAAVAMTIAPGVAWQLEEIRLHLSAAGGAAENLTATMDAGAGAVYDTVILTQAMAAVVDLIYKPARPHIFSATDALVIAYANTNTRDYGIEVYWSAI
jgi:hypothetical protein